MTCFNCEKINNSNDFCKKCNLCKRCCECYCHECGIELTFLELKINSGNTIRECIECAKIEK